MHGDTLCTDDVEYQELRRRLRDPAWQRAFLDKPLAERQRLAQGMREASRAALAGKSVEIMDVNQQTVAAALRRHGVTRLIHGHTHRPAVHRLAVDGRRCERIVLGDWYDTGSYVRCDAEGCRLHFL